MQIATRIDSERGCGWRKPGGLYLITGTSFTGCERMPLKLDRCPTCDHGVKPSRGWTWVDADALFADQPCQELPACAMCLLCKTMHRARPCPHCGHDTPHEHQDVFCSDDCDCDRTSVENFWRPGIGRAGLLWVGEKFYPAPSDFSAEAARQGISRRIHQLPREFVVDETIVLMAHRKAIRNLHVTSTEDEREAKVEFSPGIFMVLRPTSVEYVVKGDESEKTLEGFVKRGITPVHVKRLERQTSMFDENAVAPDYNLAKEDV